MRNFVGETVNQISQPDGWLLNGGGWFVLALVNAGLAEQKNRARGAWFVASLFLGPFATFLIVVWEPVTEASLEALHPLIKPDDRYLTLAFLVFVLTGVLIFLAVLGNDWYMWTASGFGAAGLVALLVLFQRARAQRIAARALAANRPSS